MLTYRQGMNNRLVGDRGCERSHPIDMIMIIKIVTSSLPLWEARRMATNLVFELTHLVRVEIHFTIHSWNFDSNTPAS
jgi:hypothetical protein